MENKSTVLNGHEFDVRLVIMLQGLSRIGLKLYRTYGLSRRKKCHARTLGDAREDGVRWNTRGDGQVGMGLSDYRLTLKRERKIARVGQVIGVTYSHHAVAIPGHHDMNQANIEFRLRPEGT